MKPLPDDPLLWVDLETTGSDPTKDCIIEVGAIVTTQDLAELDRARWTVTPTDEALGRMMRTKPVREMHEANGLLAALLRPDLAEGADVPSAVHDVTADVLRWLNGTSRTLGRPDGSMFILAGSGVGHFDRQFIRRYMPQLDRLLRYWCIDVGVIRRSVQMWGTLPEGGDLTVQKNHRALDDAEKHLDEARAYRALWKET